MALMGTCLMFWVKKLQALNRLAKVLQWQVYFRMSFYDLENIFFIGGCHRLLPTAMERI